MPHPFAKLGLKPGQRLLALNLLTHAPDLAVDVDVDSELRQPPYDVVVCFVRTRAEVAAGFGVARGAMDGAGSLWMAYPKVGGKTREVYRDGGWDALNEAGWLPVRQVALHDDWSALRFRPGSEMKNLTRSSAAGIARFSAVVGRQADDGGHFVVLPPEAVETLGLRAQMPVVALLNGHRFALRTAPYGGQHYLGLSKAVLAEVKLAEGANVEVVLERDATNRTVALPPDLAELLEAEPNVKAYFKNLAYTHRKEHVAFVEEAKRAETRVKRLEKTMELLRKKVV